MNNRHTGSQVQLSPFPDIYFSFPLGTRSLSARSFPLTAACPGQHIRKSS